MEQNDKQQQRNHYALIGFSSIIILVITVFIFSSFSFLLLSMSSWESGKKFSMSKWIFGSVALMDVTKVLSLSEVFQSQETLSTVSLSLLVLYSTFEHLFPPLSTHLVSTVYNLRWERERERNAFKANLRPVNFLSLSSQKASKVTIFSSLTTLFFSVSIYNIRSSEGEEDYKRGARKHKGVCGRVWF